MAGHPIQDTLPQVLPGVTVGMVSPIDNLHLMQGFGKVLSIGFLSGGLHGALLDCISYLSIGISKIDRTFADLGVAKDPQRWDLNVGDER